MIQLALLYFYKPFFFQAFRAYVLRVTDINAYYATILNIVKNYLDF